VHLSSQIKERSLLALSRIGVAIGFLCKAIVDLKLSKQPCFFLPFTEDDDVNDK